MRLRFLVLCVVFLFSSPVFADEVLISNTQTPRTDRTSFDCSKNFAETNQCLGDFCNLKCLPLHDPNCQLVCSPKDCLEFSADKCPAERCQLLDGCGDTKVCYPKSDDAEPSCGDLAYSGSAECCSPLIKRCGVEFFDRTCDMEGKKSIYAVPICIPCGNGICSQFENQCNCPEDCLPKEGNNKGQRKE